MSASIGVIGLGRAGISRLNALAELGIDQVTVATRRLEAFSEIQHSLSTSIQISITTDWNHFLHDPWIEVVFVCSESQAHAEQVDRLLSAGKHVVVEFPLCETYTQATHLFELARDVNRILHVESIGTLSSRHRSLREYITLERSSIQRMRSSFTGGLYRWVSEAAECGQWAFLSFGRLHQLIDLFGALTLEDLSISSNLKNSHGYTLCLGLKTLGSEPAVYIEMIERRDIGLKRTHQVELVSETGPLELEPNKRESLFVTDTAYALKLMGVSINDTSSSIPSSDYASEEKILLCHQLIDMITSRAQRPLERMGN